MQVRVKNDEIRELDSLVPGNDKLEWKDSHCFGAGSVLSALGTVPQLATSNC